MLHRCTWALIVFAAGIIKRCRSVEMLCEVLPDTGAIDCQVTVIEK